MNCIRIYRLCKQGTNCSGGSFLGIGSADELAKIFNSIVFLEDHGNDRSGRHVSNQFSIERTFLMDSVEFTCEVRAELYFFHCHDLEACLFNFLSRSEEHTSELQS